MTTFEYNPFAEGVTLTYRCPECGHKNKESLAVPSPDWAAESHHDSVSTDVVYINCNKCGREYKIELATGIYGGNGWIPEVEDISEVVEEFPHEDDYYYDSSLYQETRNETSKIIEKIDVLDDESKRVIYRLLYANVIAKMELYLKDTLIKEVMRTEESKRRFVENYSEFKDSKFELADIYRKLDSIDSLIKKTISDLIFHQLYKIKAIYKDTIGVDIGDIGELSKAVQIRHDIVHRNGKDKEGKEQIIQKEKVLNLSDRVSTFIDSIEHKTNPQYLAANDSFPY